LQMTEYLTEMSLLNMASECAWKNELLSARIICLICHSMRQ